jgi:3-oxoacyl-[acyl-carrier protein] reductase
MKRFKNQTAIITGSARGIGKGIAKRLGSEGANITLVDLDTIETQATLNELQADGVNSIIQIGDVSDPLFAQQVVENSIKEWGSIQILVNNAGIGGKNGNIWELDVDEMDRLYKVNFRGVYVFCAAVAQSMINQKYGRIVNISSVAGKEGNPRMVPYSSTKAAVIGLTKSLGKELANSGVTANCVTPAVVQTRLLEEFTQEQIDYMVSRIPIGRTGEIEEIASLVAWICSMECSFSTGAVFDISGGRSTY